MSAKKILIVNGHPNKDSFNFGLADASCDAWISSDNCSASSGKAINFNYLSVDWIIIVANYGQNVFCGIFKGGILIVEIKNIRLWFGK